MPASDGKSQDIESSDIESRDIEAQPIDNPPDYREPQDEYKFVCDCTQCYVCTKELCEPVSDCLDGKCCEASHEVDARADHANIDARADHANINARADHDARARYGVTTCEYPFVRLMCAVGFVLHALSAVLAPVSTRDGWAVLVYDLAFIMYAAASITAVQRDRPIGSAAIAWKNDSSRIAILWICKVVQAILVLLLVFPPNLTHVAHVYFDILVVYDLLVVEIATMYVVQA
jgi:hypothetical protein